MTSWPGVPSARELADHPPDGVDLEPHGAGAAAQRLVVCALEPGAADPDAGQLQHRIAVKIGLRRRGDVAHHMREGLAPG